jgi:hypothetical protein
MNKNKSNKVNKKNKTNKTNNIINININKNLSNKKIRIGKIYLK